MKIIFVIGQPYKQMSQDKEQQAHSMSSLIVLRMMQTHFCGHLMCEFSFAGARIYPHEVFDPEGMLFLFALLADDRCRKMFGTGIVRSVEVEPESLVGYRVNLLDHLGSLEYMVLIQAAEEVFGVDCSVAGTKAIELMPIIEYLSLPPEKRGETKCPWKLLKLLS